MLAAWRASAKTTFCPTRTSSATRRRRRARIPPWRVETVPLQCMHCEDAPCAGGVPDGRGLPRCRTASWEVDEGRCIGCKYCMAACPYQVRVLNEETGTVDKCRFCTVSAETSRHADVLVRGGVPDGRAPVRRFGRSRKRHRPGDRRHERAAHRRRSDQSENLLREVMNDDV